MWVNSTSSTYCRALTGLCSLLWCTGQSGNQFAEEVMTHRLQKQAVAKNPQNMKTYTYVLVVSLRWSCLCVFARGLTAGVLLAKVLRSLRLVLIRRRVLLIWRLTLWLAAWAISTPRLKHRHTHGHCRTETQWQESTSRGGHSYIKAYDVTQSGNWLTKSHISTFGHVCLF